FQECVDKALREYGMRSESPGSYAGSVFNFTAVNEIDGRHYSSIEELRSVPSLVRAGKLEEAEEILRIQQQLRPDFYFTYFWLGTIGQEKGDITNARISYHEGIMRA